MIGPAVLSLLNNLMRTHEPNHGEHAAVVGRYTAFIRRGLSCPPDHDHGVRRLAFGRSRASRSRPPNVTAAPG